MRTPTLHGRDAELARLRAIVGEARAGSGRAVLVHGPAGAGKSALLAALREDLGDARVLAVRAAEAERDLPFAGLDALLRPVLGLRERLPAVQAAALEAALALGPAVPGQVYAVGAATLSLLAAAAEDGLLVCLVDDAQWLDPSSLTALAFATRRLGDEPIALVCASREASGPDGERLALPPLPAEAAHRALADVSPRLASETAAAVVAAADGNPLVLRELAARLDRAGVMPVGPVPPHTGAEALFAERLDALPPATRQALLVEAAAGDGDAGLLDGALRAAGLSLEALEPAEAAGLVELRPGRVEPAHPLVRSVAYHGRPATERRRAHAAVAAALPDGDRRRAWHLAESATRPDEAIAAQLDAGAGDARRRGGHGSAARAQRRAADLTPDPELRARRLLEAADDFDMAGLTEDAVATVEQAATLRVSPATASRVRGHRAHLLLVQGRPAEALDLLVAEGEALREERPVSAARYLIEASFAAMELGEVERWVAHSGRALDVLGDADVSTRRVAVAMHAAARLADTGDPGDPAVGGALAMVDDLLAGGERLMGAIEVFAALAQALLWVGRADLAERLLDRLVDDGRAGHALGMLPYILGARALLRFHAGHWARSAADADEAVALAELAGRRSFLTGALAVQAVVEAWRGDAEACRAHAERAIGLAAGRARVVAWAHYALGCRAHAAGDLDAAAAHLRAAVAAGRGRASGGDVWRAELVEVLIRAGDPGAEAELAAWEREAGGEPPGARRCRALLAPEDAIDAAFAAALDGASAPLDHARTLLAHGERLRRARRRADARGPLRDALERFERLGAAPWAARARKELRATGGMVPVRTRPELQELTPHEVQVALMVAEGRTNREVAAALFLAPKTIEHHLSTIFRKLDVKRRGELARLFAGELAARP